MNASLKHTSESLLPSAPPGRVATVYIRLTIAEFLAEWTER